MNLVKLSSHMLALFAVTAFARAAETTPPADARVAQHYAIGKISTPPGSIRSSAASRCCPTVDSPRRFTTAKLRFMISRR
jgi:hypothetical protein